MQHEGDQTTEETNNLNQVEDVMEEDDFSKSKLLRREKIQRAIPPVVKIRSKSSERFANQHQKMEIYGQSYKPNRSLSLQVLTENVEMRVFKKEYESRVLKEKRREAHKNRFNLFSSEIKRHHLQKEWALEKIEEEDEKISQKKNNRMKKEWILEKIEEKDEGVSEKTNNSSKKEWMLEKIEEKKKDIRRKKGNRCQRKWELEKIEEDGEEISEESFLERDSSSDITDSIESSVIVKSCDEEEAEKL